MKLNKYEDNEVNEYYFHKLAEGVKLKVMAKSLLKFFDKTEMTNH